MSASATVSSSAKTRAAIVSIVSNACLIAIKLAAGLLTGSVGVLSDAVHSLMDLIASAISFASVRKADAPADASHHYGHEKVEDLSAGAQALLLLAGGVVIAVEAILRLINGGHVGKIGVAITVAAVAAMVNALVSGHLRRVSRTTESTSLLATASDLSTDAIVSVGVCVSLVLVAATGAEWIDPVVGLLVSVAITRTGVRILIAAGRRLADEALPDDELRTLHQVVDSFLSEEVVGVHDVRARHVGSHHQVDLHMQFTHGTSLERAHYLSHQLQDAVISELPGTTVLVHLEPEDRVRPDRIAAAATESSEQVDGG